MHHDLNKFCWYIRCQVYSGTGSSSTPNIFFYYPDVRNEVCMCHIFMSRDRTVDPNYLDQVLGFGNSKNKGSKLLLIYF